MASLDISAGPDESILLSADEEVTSNEWTRIQIAISGTPLHRDTRQLLIPVVEFVNHLNWFAHVWEDRNHKINIDESAFELIRKIQSQANEFQKLLLSNPEREFPEEINFPRVTLSLKPEQIRNIQLLLEMNNGANFSVPGAGKTLTTLALHTKLLDQQKVSKMLVVAPRSAFESWKFEAENSINPSIKTHIYTGEVIDSDAGIIITNYEQLENTKKLAHLSEWARMNNCHLVVDEAHRIKGGGTSVRWRACRSLASRASRVDVLTGTPMPQGREDLKAIFQIAWSKLNSKILSEQNLIKIRRNTAFVRTTKDELHLPPMNISRIRRDASPLQQDIIHALRDEYMGMFGLSSSESSLLAKRGKAVMSLIAAATNPGLLMKGGRQEYGLGIQWPPLEIHSNSRLLELLSRYNQHEIPWKIEYLASRVNEFSKQGQKTLIWTSFVNNIGIVEKVLQPHNPAIVHGGTPHEIRASEIERFRTEPNCKVLVTNAQTLGEGISLHQHCHNAIYLDRTYNAGLYLQSLDRIHRLGLPQTTLTNIEILVTNKSIDERIDIRLISKIQALSAFLEDPGLVLTSLPNNDELEPIESIGLSEEDLKDLFAHLSE